MLLAAKGKKRVLLCRVASLDGGKNEEVALKATFLDNSVWSDLLTRADIVKVHIPKHPPLNKEEAERCRTEYWPCALPAKFVQPPDSPPTQAYLDRLDYYMRLVSSPETAEDEISDGRLPIRCLLVPTDVDGNMLNLDSSRELDAVDIPVRLIARDDRFVSPLYETERISCAMGLGEVSRTDGRVLGHATMEALAQLAAMPGIHDKYLATRHIAFLSHEPCVMCAMALIHSRIVRVFFRVPDPVGGGFSRYFLHENKDVNHRFSVHRQNTFPT